MDRPTRALTATALAATMTVMGSGSASADQWWGGDRSGDVQQVGISPDPPPCGTVKQSAAPQDTTTDIVALSVRHEGASVELRAHFRDLTVWGDRTVQFNLATDGRDYQVQVMRWRKRGPIKTTVLVAGPPPDSVDECGGYSLVQLVAPCPDLRLTRSRERDHVSVLLPRSCIDAPHWVKAGVRTFRTVNDRFRSDTWGTTGVEPLPYAGPFGPRVRHGS